MRQRVTALSLVLLLSGFTSSALAAEKLIGTTCTGDANNVDWDTVGQCSSGAFVRANPFLAQTIAIGSTVVTAGTALDLGSNTTTANSTLLLPIGTTGARPTTGVNGMLRYNSATPAVEAYVNNAWASFLTSGSTSGIYLGTSATAANPSRASDTTTGLYTDAAGTVEIASAGTKSFSSSSTYTLFPVGSVGIGTTLPAAKLDVYGGIDISGVNGLSFPSDYTTNASVAIGSGALAYQTIATSGPQANTAIGYQAIGNSGFTTGSNNTAIGYQAGKADVGGGNVTAIGAGALSTSTAGGQTTAVGSNALHNGNGGASVAIGYDAGLYATGISNTIVGAYVAGTTLTTGKYNILIGNNSFVDTPSSSTSNFLNIGNLIYGTGLGTSSITPTGLVGIGTTTPQSSLDVNGGVTIGTSYAGINAAPTSGLLVQGSVGIGTTSPGTTLDVHGSSAADAIHISNTAGSGYLYAFSTNATSATIGMWTGSGFGNLLLSPGGGHITIGTTVPTAGVALDLGSNTTSANSSLLLPIGTTGARPTTGVNGMIRYNSSTPAVEAFVNGTWASLGGVTGGIANYVARWTGATSLGTGTLYDNGSAVGIGTSSPTAGTVLDVTGTILDRSNNAGSSASIDWSQGNAQYTSASCGAFTFTNMTDGGSYSLAVEGTTSGTCSFSQSGLTFKMPSNHGATTTGTMTFYAFLRLGSLVFVTWNPGY